MEETYLDLSHSPGTTYLEILPEEIFLEICMYLDYRDLINLKVKNLLFWKKKFLQDFPFIDINKILVFQKPIQNMGYVGRVFTDIDLYYAHGSKYEYTTIPPNIDPKSRKYQRGQKCSTLYNIDLIYIVYKLGLSHLLPDVESYNIFQVLYYLFVNKYTIVPSSEYTLDEIYAYYKTIKSRLPKSELCALIKNNI